MNLTDASAIEQALSLLAASLDSQGAVPVELVVIGGAALNVLGIRIRPTRDVDVLALCISEPVGTTRELIKGAPLPEPVVRAAVQVAAAMDFDRKCSMRVRPTCSTMGYRMGSWTASQHECMDPS